jgi:hypothetical protein
VVTFAVVAFAVVALGGGDGPPASLRHGR